MSDENETVSKSEMKAELNKAIDAFLNKGGEITKLRYADKKQINKSSRSFYHRDKQHSNEKSKEAVEKEKQKEEGMIFSKTERFSI
tara:strand:- start:641 stop:898 length:258 start_codon:yes stop_codon:yes gene_type:complete